MYIRRLWYAHRTQLTSLCHLGTTVVNGSVFKTQNSWSLMSIKNLSANCVHSKGPLKQQSTVEKRINPEIITGPARDSRFRKAALSEIAEA
jgi:hypothetical protein